MKYISIKILVLFCFTTSSTSLFAFYRDPLKAVGKESLCDLSFYKFHASADYTCRVECLGQEIWKSRINASLGYQGAKETCISSIEDKFSIQVERTPVL